MANIYYLIDNYDIYLCNERKTGYSLWTPGNEVCGGKTKIVIELTDDKFTLPSSASKLFANSRATISNLNKFDTSGCTDKSYMFHQAINQLSFTGVSGWDTSNVTTMKGMFAATTQMYYLDVSNWDTSSVTDMSEMFYSAGHSGNKITINISGWDTSNVRDMSYMFKNCSVKNVNTSNIITSNVTNMTEMFSGGSWSTIDVSSFDTSNVTSFYRMFYNCSGITSLDLSNWNTSSATTMESMFNGCSNLTDLDVKHFDVSNCVRLDSMFSGTGITSLDIRGWDLRNATHIVSMFAHCSNLRYLRIEDVKVRTEGSNYQQANYMFDGDSNLTNVFASPNTDWNNAKMLGPAMFGGCTSILNWDGTVSIERANNVRTGGYFGFWEGDYEDYSLFEKKDNMWIVVTAFQKDSDTWKECDTKMKVIE